MGILLRKFFETDINPFSLQRLDTQKTKHQDDRYCERQSEIKILSIKSSIYFNSEIHQTLRQRASNNRTSLSAQVNEAVGNMLREDLDDLAAFEQRAPEPEISRKALLAHLKRHRKL